MRYAIGCDIGGTRIKCGAVREDGYVIARRTVPARAELGAEALLETIRGEIEKLRAEVDGEPVGLGLGLSGAVDPEIGTVYLPGKFKGLEGFPMVPRLSAKTGCRVRADNDARLILLAERKFGMGAGCDWLVSLTIGTGLGSGVMLDGKVLRDPHLQFGTQLGHLVIQADGGKLCLTNAYGTGETLCSATALTMAVRDGLHRGIPSSLSDRYFADPHSIDFSAVIESMEGGDRLCRAAFSQWRHYLGCVVINAVHAYAPELVIIGGGGAHAARHFLDDIRERVRNETFRYPPNRPVAIEVSRLIEDAGVLGAASLFLEEK